MTNQGGAGSTKRHEWQVLICTDGYDGGLELERTVRHAGFPVSVVRNARRLRTSLHPAVPVIAALSDAVDGWMRIVGDLHRARPLLRIFLITDLDARLELVTALSAGVDGIGRHGDPPEATLRAIVGLCEVGVSLPRALVKDLVGEVRDASGRTVRAVNGTVQVTDREWQILQLMLQGRTTGEMAAELYLAKGTVRSHVSALLGKLGVSSRRDAVALMERR